MNALFGDATTAMPTPASQAERGSLIGIGSPASIDIRQNTAAQPGTFNTDAAIPGLDIDPPEVGYGEDGKPLLERRGRTTKRDGEEGVGNWISRMASRTKKESPAANRGDYGRLDQDER
jgi:hypothetical protein